MMAPVAIALLAGIGGYGEIAIAQPPKVDALIDSYSAPGVTGRKLLTSGRIRPTTYQPIRIDAPTEAIVSTSDGVGFSEEPYRPVLGLLVGRAYRFKVSYVTEAEEHNVYPTVELIDSLDAPAGKAQEFPVPIEFTAEEIKLASSGNMVTRVVYLEDPKMSLPATYRRGKAQPYFETDPGTDPLAVADTLGRPIAIVRIGSRTPEPHGPTSAFLFQSPPMQRYESVPIESVPVETQAAGPGSRNIQVGYTRPARENSAGRQRQHHSQSQSALPKPVRAPKPNRQKRISRW